MKDLKELARYIDIEISNIKEYFEEIQELCILDENNYVIYNVNKANRSDPYLLIYESMKKIMKVTNIMYKNKVVLDEDFDEYTHEHYFVLDYLIDAKEEVFKIYVDDLFERL